VNIHDPSKQPQQPLPSLYYTPPVHANGGPPATPRDRRSATLRKDESSVSRGSSNASSDGSEVGSVVINVNDDVATDDLDKSIQPRARVSMDEDFGFDMDTMAWEDDDVDVATRFASHFTLLSKLLASNSDQERRIGEVRLEMIEIFFESFVMRSFVFFFPFWF